jgi:hypothetical protein
MGTEDSGNKIHYATLATAIDDHLSIMLKDERKVEIPFKLLAGEGFDIKLENSDSAIPISEGALIYFEKTKRVIRVESLFSIDPDTSIESENADDKKNITFQLEDGRNYSIPMEWIKVGLESSCSDQKKRIEKTDDKKSIYWSLLHFSKTAEELSAFNNEKGIEGILPQGRISHQARLKMEYQEVANLIRHYSTVRSALSSFLVSLGVGSFGFYFRVAKEQREPFIWIAGHLLILISFLVCLYFSYRTERAQIYSTRLWHWLSGKNITMPTGYKAFPDFPNGLWGRVGSDMMNYILIFGGIVMAIFFWVSK